MKPYLPVHETPLVGRRAELDIVMGYVREADPRLVTLTGLGGTGKSRLALEAGRQLADEFEASYFVDLAPIKDPKLVGSAIADALGVREAHDRSIAETLGERIGDTPTLIVLDSFDQVMPASPLLGEVLTLSPNLKFIATSRAPLHVRDEREYAVPPLGLPVGSDAEAASAAVQCSPSGRGTPSRRSS